MGSRYQVDSERIGVSYRLRRLLAKVFSYGVKWLLFYGPKDTQCGFKGFSRRASRYIFSNIKTDSVLYDLEIFLLAKKNNFKVVEISVPWKHDYDSRLTYNFKKSLVIWLELFRLKYLYRIIVPIKIAG